MNSRHDLSFMASKCNFCHYTGEHSNWLCSCQNNHLIFISWEARKILFSTLLVWKFWSIKKKSYQYKLDKCGRFGKKKYIRQCIYIFIFVIHNCNIWRITVEHGKKYLVHMVILAFYNAIFSFNHQRYT